MSEHGEHARSATTAVKSGGAVDTRALAKFVAGGAALDDTRGSRGVANVTGGRASEGEDSAVGTSALAALDLAHGSLASSAAGAIHECALALSGGDALAVGALVDHVILHSVTGRASSAVSHARSDINASST